MTKVFNKIVKQFGELKLLIIAKDFEGWKDLSVAEKHFGFVKSHHHKVLKLAIVTDHVWQKLLAYSFKMFLHPQIKIFDEKELHEAKKWIMS